MTQANNKTKAVLARHLRESQTDFQLRMAGLEDKEGVPNSAGHVKRAIPKGYVYDPKTLKPLAKTLWAMSVALGHALTAHKHFTKIKSATVSPDGLIGGRGYVMSVKDIRKVLYDACEGLSAVSDTIHDELHAPHWKSKLAQLERDDKEVDQLIKDAEKNLEDPEDAAEADLEEIEQGSEAKASIPDGEDLADSHGEPMHTKQAASPYFTDGQFYFPAKPPKTLIHTESNCRQANSSEPVETLSGPRVQHLDRGDQTGPYGSYNTDEPASDDAWGRDEGVGSDYAYQSEWDNEALDRAATSNVPGVLTDTTPTEARDFGLGYGARGEGSEGYGTKAPDGKGVYGPYAELPSDPAGRVRDESSATSYSIDSRRSAKVKWKASVLPNDVIPSVARSDYYEGDKGDNQVNADSGLPGVVESDYEHDIDVSPEQGYRSEQTQPYIKWSPTTHEMREDPIYQRGPIQGPFVNKGHA